MIVQLREKKYSVTWHYTRDRENRPLVQCFISELGQEKGMRRPVVMGQAACSARDRFVRNTGRKISLERALLTEVPNQEKQWHPIFEKSDRALVWEEYFKLRGNKF